MPDDNQMKYPGEGQYYNQGPQTGSSTSQNFGPVQGGKLADQPPKQLNIWRVIALVMSATTILFAITTALAYYGIISAKPRTSTTTTVAVTPQKTPVVNVQPTSPPALAPTPTIQSPTSSDYSAAQPGPGCDTNGGTWTPQGLGSITCGTRVTTSTDNSRGYLYLQLPNNKAFSPNNTIGIIGDIGSSGYGGQCVGLDEQDANKGFLAEYCDGSWAIYSISSDGTIVQTLDKSITSTRSTEDISLTLKGTTLSFSIDNEVHKINSVSPIQPIKVAITYYANGGIIATNNFSYITLSD